MTWTWRSSPIPPSKTELCKFKPSPVSSIQRILVGVNYFLEQGVYKTLNLFTAGRSSVHPAKYFRQLTNLLSLLQQLDLT